MTATEWTPEMEAICRRHGGADCEKNSDHGFYEFLYNPQGYRAFLELETTFPGTEFWYSAGWVGICGPRATP